LEEESIKKSKGKDSYREPGAETDSMGQGILEREAFLSTVACLHRIFKNFVFFFITNNLFYIFR
jgi:hypothetical protein